MKNSKLKLSVLGVLHFAFCILQCLGDGTPVIPATQTEVNAGTIHNKYVAPDTLAHWPGGGGFIATNGLTQAQYKAAIESGTNGTFAGTNVSVTKTFTGSLVVTNGLTNLALTASTDLEADANKKLISLANAAGMKTNDGAGNVGYTFILPAGTDLSLATNLLNLAKFTAGANITLTPAKDAKTGATNWTVAVSDPASLGQINAGTLWATNFVTTTNNMGGTAVDFSTSECTTNMAGNMTLSTLANLTAGAYNRKLIHCLANGADRTISIPTGWGQGLTDTFTVTNGTRKDVLVVCQPGVFTNAFQKDIITH